MGIAAVEIEEGGTEEYHEDRRADPSMSPTDPSDGQALRPEAPDDRGAVRRFREACREAGVSSEEIELLADLFERWEREGLTEAEHIEELIEDYRHLEVYRSSRDGDAEAARCFEEHWSEAVRKFLGPRRHLVDELTGLFFERVYRLVDPEFHWNCPFQVYLKTVLVNLHREIGRKRTRRRKKESSLDHLEERGVAFPQCERDGPERLLLRRELVEAVRRSLEELRPGDRHIVRVCMLEGGSGQELAAELGISRDALYQRLRRAKKRLRRVVEARGITGGAV